MSEKTAQFLATLSHQWLPALFVATACSVALAVVAQRGRKRKVYVAAVLLTCASAVSFLGSLLHIGCASLTAHSSLCMSNLKKNSQALLLYAQDYSETFSPPGTWTSAVLGRADTVSLRCPSAESRFGYGMNARTIGISLNEIDAPAETVLLFDSLRSIPSLAGSATDVATRHTSGANIAFVDGRAKWARGESIANQRW